MTDEGEILLGNFRLLKKLGQGANGTVYKAEDLSGTPQAIKIYHKPLDGEEEKNLARELTIASTLNDPGLVKYISTKVEQANGRQFIRMELVDGTSLKDKAKWDKNKCHPQAIPDIHQWLKAIVPALGKLHAAGVVHRDLHAGNLMLCPDGSAKVVDFGSARTQEATEGDQTFRAPGSLTHSAPETWDAPSRATPSSDYFSLGVVLYLVTTGQLPFWEGSLLRLGKRIESGVHTPPSDIRPDAPAWLCTAIECLLEPQENARWQEPEKLLKLLKVAGEDPALAAYVASGMQAESEAKKRATSRDPNPFELSESGAKVAFWLYQHDKTGDLFQLFDPGSIFQELGLDPSTERFVVQELEDKSVAQVKHYSGGPKLGPNCLTPFAVPAQLDYDPENDLILIVRTLIAEGGWTSAAQLAQVSRLSIPRVNRAVLVLELRDLIEVKKYMGTSPYAFGRAQANYKTQSILKSEPLLKSASIPPTQRVGESPGTALKYPSRTVTFVPDQRRSHWTAGLVDEKPAMFLSIEGLITNTWEEPVQVPFGELDTPHLQGDFLVEHSKGGVHGRYDLIPGRSTHCTLLLIVAPPLVSRREAVVAKFDLIDQFGNHHGPYDVECHPPTDGDLWPPRTKWELGFGPGTVGGIEGTGFGPPESNGVDDPRLVTVLDQKSQKGPAPLTGKLVLRLDGKATLPSAANAASYSTAYFTLVHDLDISIEEGDQLVYASWCPDLPGGGTIGVDLEFSDGTSMRDLSFFDHEGRNVHPGNRDPLPRGRWNDVRVELSRKVGGVIRKVKVCYDNGFTKKTGDFRAFLGHLTLQNPDVTTARRA